MNKPKRSINTRRVLYFLKIDHDEVWRLKLKGESISSISRIMKLPRFTVERSLEYTKEYLKLEKQSKKRLDT